MSAPERFYPSGSSKPIGKTGSEFRLLPVGWRTDGRRGFLQEWSMETKSSAIIVAWDRLDNGLILSFADGRCAFYSDALLYSMVDSADGLKMLEADELATLIRQQMR